MLQKRVAARRHNFHLYQQWLDDLPGLEFMPEASFGTSTRWLTCLTLNPGQAGIDREQLRLNLAEHRIEARPVWKPLHLQPVFDQCECIGGAIANDLFQRGLCLPSGSNLSISEIESVAEQIKAQILGKQDRAIVSHPVPANAAMIRKIY